MIEGKAIEGILSRYDLRGEEGDRLGRHVEIDSKILTPIHEVLTLSVAPRVIVNYLLTLV